MCPFPPHGCSAPDGLPLLLRKQPIWAAGDTPHLMLVEQGLPWHPVATGLAGQAIPFIVAASHAHALPCARSPIPSILLPCSRCSGCLSCLAVPLLLVCCACPCPSWCGSRVLCVCVAPPPVCWRSWVPLSRTPSCPTRLPPRTRVSHLRMTWAVPCAVGWSRPCCHARGGHLLAPPPPPPPKSVMQFQGIEASEAKNPLGDYLIGQKNDFTRGWTSNIMPWGRLRE